MKTKILKYAIATMVVSSVALGCSSQKNAGSTDTTAKDTTRVTAPPPITDTMKKDTMKKDTSKPPQ